MSPGVCRCGNHLTQSQRVRRSARVASTMASSAGPYRVVASISSVRASASRKVSVPTTAAGRSCSSVIETCRNRWPPTCSSTRPNGRHAPHRHPPSTRRCQSNGSDRSARRTASTTSGVESSTVNCGDRLNWTEPSWSASNDRRRFAPGADGSTVNTRVPATRCWPAHGVGPDTGRPSSSRHAGVVARDRYHGDGGSLDDHLEHRVLDGCIGEFDGGEATPRPDAIAPSLERADRAGAGARQLQQLDGGPRRRLLAGRV